MSSILQLLVSLKAGISSAIGGISGGTDSLFNYVVLLLTGDAGSNVNNGANNNVIVESSSLNAAMTRTGTPYQGSFTPHALVPGLSYSPSTNGGSWFFNGGGDRISTTATNAAYAIGTNQFTVDMWVNMTALQNGQFIGTGISGAGVQWVFGYSTTYGLFFYYGTYGANQTIQYVGPAGTPAIKTWFHFAVQRGAGNTWTIFINGVAQATSYFNQNVTWNNAISIPANILYVGSGQSGNFSGFLSEVRLVIGSALYSGNFTPPTVPSTAVSGTVLLLNATNGGVVDAVAKNNVNTLSTSSLDIGAKISGAASLKFNGTTDYMQTSSNGGYLTFGVQDFTVEFWVYFNSLSTSPTLFDTRVNSGDAGGFDIYMLTTGQPAVFANNVQQLLTSTKKVLTIAQWYHIALSKKSNIWTLFVNGEQYGSFVYATSLTNTYAKLGSSLTPSGFLNGYIDDVRVTAGVARYTTNYNVPTSQASHLASVDPQVGYDVLLMNGNNLSGSDNSTFIESSGQSALTKTGVPNQGSFSPFNLNWSYYFNGSSDNFSLPSTGMILGTGDFTVETFVYLLGVPAVYGTIIDCRPSISYSTFAMGLYNVSGVTKVDFVYGASRLTSNATVPVNKWVHIAFVRSSGILSIYINGVADTATVNLGSTAISSPGATAYIGRNLDGNFFSGYMSNLRIVNDTALYTGATATIPTSRLGIVGTTTLLTLQDGTAKDNSSINAPISRANYPRALTMCPVASSEYDVTAHGGSINFTVATQKFTTTSFALGTNDFTLEAWVYPQPLLGNRASIFGQGTTDTVNSVGLFITSTGTFVLYASSADRIVTTTTVGFYQWTHIALTRAGNVHTIWINGVNSGTWTGSANNYSSATFAVNQSYGTYVGGIVGNMSSVRAVVGTSIYSSNFTPATSPLSSVSNTKILMQGTNATIIDYTGFNSLVPVGSPARASGSGKFGSGSIYFNGASSIQVPYVALTQTHDFYSAVDYTIEAWIYPTTTPGTYMPIFAKHNAGTTNDWEVLINSSNQISIRWWVGSARTVVSAAAVNVNAWNHVAMVYCGYNQTMMVFLNGVMVSALHDITAATNDAINLDIGGSGGGLEGAPIIYFSGYMDDIRVSKGYARYMSTFTPPSAVPISS